MGNHPMILPRCRAVAGSRVFECGVHMPMSQDSLHAPDRHPGVEQ